MHVHMYINCIQMDTLLVKRATIVLLLTSITSLVFYTCSLVKLVYKKCNKEICYWISVLNKIKCLCMIINSYMSLLKGSVIGLLSLMSGYDN